MAKQCLAFVICFVIWWAYFNYYIIFICTYITKGLYLLYLPKMVVFVKTKNKKKKILFIVTWLELSVLYMGEFFVREFSAGTFSRYDFQYGPRWHNCKNETFFKSYVGFWRFLFTLNNTKLYFMLESY